MNVLNDDIIIHMLGFCSTPALATMSLVSSQLHTISQDLLLSTMALDKDPKQLLSFLDFILKTTCVLDSCITGPGQLIQHLEIKDLAFQTWQMGADGFSVPASQEPYPVSAWGLSLTKPLALMPNLHSIIICNMIEEIIKASPDFAMAILS